MITRSRIAHLASVWAVASLVALGSAEPAHGLIDSNEVAETSQSAGQRQRAAPRNSDSYALQVVSVGATAPDQ